MPEFRVDSMNEAIPPRIPLRRRAGRNLSWLTALLGGAALVRDSIAQPYGLESRPAIGPFLDHRMPESAPRISGKWSAVVAFPNLLFTNALGLTCVPGTSNLCVWEREGRVWSFANRPDTATRTLVLDISHQCQGWDDSGLLGLAFHPGFATNRFMFVYYTWVVPGTVAGNSRTRPDPIRAGAYHDRLSRFTLDAAGVAIPGSEQVLVDQVGNSVWHNGGGLFFHPANGFLYWADGDDADSGNTQIIDRNLFSGVFRIDVDQRGGSISHPIRRQPANGATAHYYVPNDNPFVGQPGALEEFFCLGLRNPHRMTCDPVSGRIFIGDVGESAREEVDVIEPGEKGLNFQWSRIEGAQGDLGPPYLGISRGPILDYPHSDGRAIIGGYVYRGKRFAGDLGGKYIFGDNVLRIVWALDESTARASKLPLCIMPKGSGPSSGTDYTGLSSFGVDALGEIYLCQMSSIGGQIYTLARSGAPPPQQSIPLQLSRTGVFRDLASLQPAAGLVPYAVNAPLWSDGAAKSRWMALPRGQPVTFAPVGEWTFPSGTVFVKNFELPVNETNPALVRRLETRLIVRDTNGYVYGASYKWRADLSDADLVSTGITEAILIATPSGARTQLWFYPGRQDCLSCHTVASGGVLGVNARQLNRPFTYPSTGITDNQLRTWNHLGLFEPTLREDVIPRLAALVSVNDTRASLESRARSYLDSNCAYCHRPGGAHAFFDARSLTPLDQAGILNGPVENALDLLGAKVVVPGNGSRSILFRRIASSGGIKMPPLARNVVDAAAVTLFGQWIDSLPPASNALPPSWIDVDVGNVGLHGEATCVNGQFNLKASGEDMWQGADAFHCAVRQLTGDGQITARAIAVQQTDPWAKAGVMFRESMSPGSPYAAILVTPANGAVFQNRAVAGGPSANRQDTTVAVPCWLRLVRRGPSFSSYVSADGSHWSLVGTASFPSAPQLYVGLVLTAHNNSALNSALFDNVTVSNSTAP